MPLPDFRAVADAAAREASHLVPRWLPNGRGEGNEWVAANPRRPDSDGGGAFRVNVAGGKAGKWADFAYQDGSVAGLDLISLYAYLHGVKNGEACIAVAAELGIDPNGSGMRVVGGTGARQAKSDPDGVAVVPAPADAPPIDAALDHFRLGRPSRHWLYRGTTGALLMAVARWDLPTATDPGAKEIMPLSLWRLPSGAMRWKWKALPKPWPLYRLDELVRRPAAIVVVCEGEKAADAAQLLLPEYVATTSPSGSKNAARADWSPLAGRRVLIWPDHDEPGLGYASAVREKLLDEGAASIQVLSFGWVAKVLAAVRGGNAA